MNKFFFIVLTMVFKMWPIGKIEFKKIVTCTSPHIMSCELLGFTLQPQLYSAASLSQPTTMVLFFLEERLNLKSDWPGLNLLG